VSARQICRLGSGLVLPRHRDDLLFRTPCPLHQSVGVKAGLILQLEEKFGAVQMVQSGSALVSDFRFVAIPYYRNTQVQYEEKEHMMD
jgi:hypothetical protein